MDPICGYLPESYLGLCGGRVGEETRPDHHPPEDGRHITADECRVQQWLPSIANYPPCLQSVSTALFMIFFFCTLLLKYKIC